MFCLFGSCFTAVHLHTSGGGADAIEKIVIHRLHWEAVHHRNPPACSLDPPPFPARPNSTQLKVSQAVRPRRVRRRPRRKRQFKEPQLEPIWAPPPPPPPSPPFVLPICSEAPPAPPEEAEAEAAANPTLGERGL